MFGISAFSETSFAALAGTGDNAIVNLTGQAATGGVGTVALPETVTITGQSSTGAVGATTLSGLANIVPTGQQTSALISGLAVGGSVIAILPSLLSTVGAVSVSIDGEANVSIPLEDEGEGQVGSPVIQANSDVALTGQAATSALGTATTVTFNTIAVSGFTATTAVGEFTIVGKANITPNSVSATTGTGVVNIWSLAIDAQNANYSGVDSSQTPNYTNVNDSQTPDWQDVA